MIYQWIFEPTKVVNQNGLSNVILEVNFELRAIDGDVMVSRVGSYGINQSDPSNFIAFEKVTNFDIENWMKSSGEALMNSMKESLAIEIAQNKTAEV